MVGKRIDQLAQRTLGVVVLIELIGIREQIALQPGDVLGGVVNKAVVIIGGLGGFQQVFLGIDALFRQQTDGLHDGVALRDGHGDGLRRQIAGGIVHSQNQGAIIHLRVQLIGADADFPVGMGDPGVKLEKPLVLNQPRIMELFGHGGHAVLRRYLHSRLFHSAPVEGAEIRAKHPAHSCQNGGSQQNKQQIAAQPQHRVPSPAAGMVALGVTGRRALPPLLRPPDFLCIPAGGILSSVFGHSFLLTSLSALRHRANSFKPLSPRSGTLRAVSAYNKPINRMWGE